MSRLLVGLLAAAAAIVIVGAAVRWLDDRAAPPIVISDPLPATTIAVSVEGAVASPGVYELSANARHADAVAAAGGLTDVADLAAFNPARRVRDEERIIVAELAPAKPNASGDGGNEASSASTTVETAGGRLDLNAATAEELAELPGIGPVLAERIVAARAERGPFTAVDDLAAVEGISRRMVEDLRPLVSVGP